MKNRFVLALLFVGCLYFLLPLITSSHLFLYRSNDLDEFFWPFMLLYKRSIIQYHQLPLWNGMWFGGMPFISDPQTPSLYLPNLIFLFLPIDLGFVVSVIIHLFAASLFFYLFLRELSLNKLASVSGALIYISTPRFAASLEAGHYGLITVWTWIACSLYLILLISKRGSYKLLPFLAISLTYLIESHLITATFVVPTLLTYWFINSKSLKKFLSQLIICLLITFCFLAPSLLPQINWVKLTTRSLLTTKPEIYPIWSSKLELFKYFLQETVSKSHLETEKTISVGIVVTLLSAVTFFALRKRWKIFLILSFFILLLLAWNNTSPFYSFYKESSFFSQVRVLTRVWVVAIVALITGCAIAISKVKDKKLAIFLSIAAISNSYFLGWQVLAKPYGKSDHVPNNVYKYIVSQPHGRVWCIRHCINQRLAAEYNIDLIDGYATLQQTNYYNTSWSLFGGYWDYYTLAVPPFGTDSIQKFKPNYELLGKYSVSHIISREKLNNIELDFQKNIDGFNIYKNKLAKPIFYSNDSDSAVTFERLSYQSFNIKAANLSAITMSSIYSPGWNIYDQGKIIKTGEGPEHLISIENKSNASNLTIQYDPPGFLIGIKLLVTGIILSLIILLPWRYFFNNFVHKHGSSNKK